MAIGNRGLTFVVILLVLNACVPTTWAVTRAYHAQHGAWLKACPGDMRINIIVDVSVEEVPGSVAGNKYSSFDINSLRITNFKYTQAHCNPTAGCVVNNVTPAGPLVTNVVRDPKSCLGLLASLKVGFKITVTLTGGQTTEEWVERVLSFHLPNRGLIESGKKASTGVATFVTVRQQVDTCSV
ncbi:hypothetical protein HDU93_005132 [Gonapodya sp. JEL0774]|nr:hypothetical protein HDU93_005132 [Gonapodya sp. JEL0774]